MIPAFNNSRNSVVEVDVKCLPYVIFSKLTLSVPKKKKKNSIFVIPIIPNILNINNLGSSSENSIILDITRKLIKYYFKNASDKAMFTLIVFEISLFEGKSVL